MSGKTINIVTGYSYGLNEPLPDDCRLEIEAVSPRIRVRDITPLVKAERGGDSGATRRIDAIMAEAEIYCGFYIIDHFMIRGPKLKWIQAANAGVDQFLTDDIVSSNVILTRATIHDQQISETVFNLMLMLARSSLDYLRAQERRERVRLIPDVLYGKTIGILGLGNIGRGVAKRAKAFGMKVMATKTHPVKYSYVDVMLPASGLHEVMQKSDYVIVLLPITEATRNLIGEAELKMMKPSAYIINVARGDIIKQEPLIRALKGNWIAGAGLDVLASDPGPVPDDVWELQNVILTPHIAGQRKDYSQMLTKLFVKNLKRYLKGRELMNVVDKKGGY